MPEKPRALSKEEAPDPANTYERTNPSREAGMGRLDTNRNATPRKAPDKMPKTVRHAQDGSKQINAHDDNASRSAKAPVKKVSKSVGWRGKKKSK